MKSVHSLFLSYDGMTDPLGQSQVIPYLSGLRQRGYAVTIMSFEKPNAKGRREVIQKELKRQGIEWVPLRYTKSPPILSTLYDIFQMKRAAYRLYSQRPFQIVHARSYVSALTALHLKKKFGVKFIFDMRGFWPDERVDGGLWNLKNPLYNCIYKYFKRKEAELLRDADHIITLTEAARDQIQSWKLLNQPLPIEVIPCCVDLEVFSLSRASVDAKESWMRKLEIRRDDFVLTYLGSIGTWYRIEEMLSFFQVILKKFPTAKFLFVTKADPGVIYQKSGRFGLGRDQIKVVAANREDVPSIVSLSSASIFFYGVERSRSGFSPTKAAELLSLGIPIICNSGVGDCDSLVQREGVGVLVADFRKSSYERAVSQLDECLRLPKERIARVAQKYFDLSLGVERYERVYRKLSV